MAYTMPKSNSPPLSVVPYNRPSLRCIKPMGPSEKAPLNVWMFVIVPASSIMKTVSGALPTFCAVT